MDRNEAFALKFENPSLKIVAAGIESPLKDVVLYGKGDDEYTGDDEYSSAEFLLTPEMVEAFDEAYKNGDMNCEGQGYVHQGERTKVEITIVDTQGEYIYVDVTDEYDRTTTLTIFDTDIEKLLTIFK